ncbi:exodeoxyribonuclease VII large subunit [Micrococcus flavus]|uniref:Exodeoxyribonuclease 7 large subunit n=1 Tax=Micrococcus flavus TaxID=384602 RepID=A0A7W7P9V7_9MICC|nr:exodeoxyribonuclease VII large subunit [Micrococcus flavus]GGK51297.1 exodeoxyribonuclease 7 large subunit [Micrococcus flavus]
MEDTTPQDDAVQHAGGAAGEPAEPGPVTASETSPERPWPLHRLSENLKLHIERAPATWIEGQLIEFKNNRGNVYMTMRDLDQEVSLPLAAWRNVAAGIDPTVQQGSRVVARVKPNFWLKAGRLSMNVLEMKPVGLGDLLARVELLRRSLAEEGLTSPARKRPLPVLPGVIGLITGRDSDAMKDVLRNTHLRWPAAVFEVREVAVQGTDAPRQVAAALAELDADPTVEVIVIARGGGALEEVVLPFSDEALVRAVAAAGTPVVSAIGHEADRPVLDDVADLRASTPTDAAKRIVPDAAQEALGLAHARERMAAAVERRVRGEAEALAALRSRPVLAHPHVMVDARAEDLGRWRERARVSLGHRLARESDAVAALRARVRALSPQQTLDRGYAVVQHAGRVVRRADEVSPGSHLDILVAAGRLEADVTDTHTPTDPEDA